MKGKIFMGIADVLKELLYPVIYDIFWNAVMVTFSVFIQSYDVFDLYYFQ